MSPESKTPENYTAWKSETSEKTRENETIAYFLRLADAGYALKNLLKKSEWVIADTAANGRKIRSKEYDLLKTTRKETAEQAKLMLGKVESTITILLKPPFALEKIYTNRLGKPISSLTAAEAEAIIIGNELQADFANIRDELAEEITEKNKNKEAAGRIMSGENWLNYLEKLKILPGAHHRDLKVNKSFRLLLSGGMNEEDAVVLLQSFGPHGELTAVEQRFALLEIEDLTVKDFKEWQKILQDAGKTVSETVLFTGAEINSPTIEMEVGEFSFNEREAKRLGLEPMRLESFPQADALIGRLFLEPNEQGFIDIINSAGQDEFCQEWGRLMPTVPPPCIPREAIWKNMSIFRGVIYPVNINKADGNFWYLKQLKSKKIITNLADKHTLAGAALPNQNARSHFGEAEFLLVDAWEEKDYNVADASVAHTSSLLRELLGGQANKTSTVNIKRESLDAALWDGDPADRKPAAKHKEILVKLGVDPSNYELRCISQDEYARGSVAKNWGKKELWTNFDNYFLGGGARYGLAGGCRSSGGAAIVDYYWRGPAYSTLAVRLVLSRKH